MMPLFDFGLSTDAEERARRIHNDSIIIDLVGQHIGGSNIFAALPDMLREKFHSALASERDDWQRLTRAEHWLYEAERDHHSTLIRDWYAISGLTCGTYAIGVHDGHDPHCLKLDEVNTLFDELPWTRRVTTGEQIRSAKRDGVTAFYAHWQPLNPAPRDLSAIDVAYAKGLRSFMLTYNQMDSIGVGCTERVDAGLSTFGIDVVRHCNQIGMIVDVSHCGHLTTIDACRHSTRPVNANHSCSKALWEHARGKSDDALKAIADTGGVIGVVAVPQFLTGDARPSINHMLDHIDYIAGLVGWRHVAIGTDWPLQVPLDVLEQTLGRQLGNIGFRDKNVLDFGLRLEGFDDGRELPNITRGLVARGYNDEEIGGILGENALRVFEEVCG